jgi:hypothetical protein
MSDDIHRTLGAHDARIESLQYDVAEIKRDMKLILAAMSEAKGGWKTLVMVSGIAGSCGAIIGKLLPFWK